MLYRTTVEWHDLEIAPDDLPEAESPVMITVETLDRQRMVWLDAYLKETEDDRTIFCTTGRNEFTGEPEECAVWYPVVAWAYPPEPMFDRFGGEWL